MYFYVFINERQVEVVCRCFIFYSTVLVKDSILHFVPLKILLLKLKFSCRFYSLRT